MNWGVDSDGRRLPYRILLFTLPFPSVALLTLGGFGLQMSHVSLVIAVAVLVVVVAREKQLPLNRTVGLFSLLLLCVVVASYAWFYVTPPVPYFTPPFPSSPGQLLYWVSAVGYLTVANVYTSYVKDFETVYRDWVWFAAGAAAALLVGAYEIISYYSMVPFPYEIVYSNPTFKIYWGSKIAGIKRFTSSFPEPSMFALYGSVALGVIYGLRRRLLLVVFTGGMLLALSTSAVIGLVGVAVGILYLAPIMNHRQIPGICGASFVLAGTTVVVSETLQKALYTTTIGKVHTHSGRARLETLLTGLRAWIESPILGWGLGAARTTDGLSMLLITFGVVGAVPLGWFFFRTMSLPVNYRLARGLRAGLFAGLIVHLASGPDWTFPFIWVVAGALWSFPSIKDFRTRCTK